QHFKTRIIEFRGSVVGLDLCRLRDRDSPFIARIIDDARLIVRSLADGLTQSISFFARDSSGDLDFISAVVWHSRGRQHPRFNSNASRFDRLTLRTEFRDAQ